MDFGTFDIESSIIEETDKQRFLMAGLYADGFYQEFYTEKDLINAFSKCKVKRFYAHFLDYDFRFLLNILNSKYTLNIIPRNSGVLKIECYDKNPNRFVKLFELRDSFALIPLSLKDLTKAFSKEYVKLAYDIEENIPKICRYSSIYEARNNPDVLEMRKYLKYDCLSLYESLHNFMDILNIKNLSLTLGNIMFRELKKTFDYNAIKQNSSYDDLFRKTLAGGRTEVFKPIIDTDLNYYDFISSYPKVATYSFPFGKLSRTYSPYEHYDFYIADISVVIPDEFYIPPLFTYDNKRMKLMFYTGKIRGWYNSIDISILEDLGIPYKVNKKYIWNDDKNFLRGFTLEKYAIKERGDKENNEGLRTIGKIGLNSGVFGKFSERKKSNTLFIAHNFDDYREKLDEIDDENRERKAYGQKEIEVKSFTENDDDLILLIERNKIQNFSTSHISSFITSYARKNLFNRMNEVIEKDGEVYYCDTDSFITDIEVKTGDRLGDLKKEFDVYSDTGFFALPKIYNFDGFSYKKKKEISIIKSKGVRGLTKNQIRDMVMRDKSIEIYNMRISKIKSILKGVKKPTECYSHKLVLSAKDQKRKVNRYINDSMPYMKNELNN